MREVLQSIVEAADAHGDAEAASIYGRTGLLRRVLALAVLPPEDLILLASSSEVRTLQAGQRLPSPRDPQHAFFVTQDAELELRAHNGLSLRLAPFSVFTFEPGAQPVETVTDTVLVRIEPTSVFELAAEEPELIPGLVRAAEALGDAAA